MNLREEIEKLETHRHPYQPGYLTTDEFLRKSDILWILGEHLGECVTEGIMDFGLTAAGYRCVLSRRGLFDILSNEKGIRPGDHISIYARRKNESSS